MIRAFFGVRAAWVGIIMKVVVKFNGEEGS